MLFQEEISILVLPLKKVIIGLQKFTLTERGQGVFCFVICYFDNMFGVSCYWTVHCHGKIEPILLSVIGKNQFHVLLLMNPP